MLAEMSVVVAIGQIDPRYWPESRAVHQKAIRTDQSDSSGLRQVFDALQQKFMERGSSHDAIELLGIPDAGGRHLGLHLLEYQIDRLDRACCLLAEHEAELGRLVPRVG